VAPEPPRVIPWNIMRFWRGASHAFSSTIDMVYEVITAFMPKIHAALQRFMPENKIGSLIQNCTPPVYSIIDHSLALATTLEQRGLYEPVTQRFIEPIRQNFQTIDIKALQAAIAIYKYQFEPLLFKIVEENDDASLIWGSLSPNQKNELILNAAALINQLRKCFHSLLPLMDPRVVARLHEALRPCQSACFDFDSIIEQITLLQIFLKKDAEPLLAQVIDILGQTADTVTAGSATNTALKQTLGTMVGGTLGVVAERTVDTLNMFQLDLSFNPTRAGVNALPIEWNDKNLKNILKDEMVQTLGLIKQVDALNLSLQYAAPDRLFGKSTLGTVM